MLIHTQMEKAYQASRQIIDYFSLVKDILDSVLLFCGLAEHFHPPCPQATFFLTISGFILPENRPFLLSFFFLDTPHSCSANTYHYSLLVQPGGRVLMKIFMDEIMS